MNADTLAFELLAELQRRAGSTALDQVDLVACEDEGRTTMAYCYAPDGSCTPICFDTPLGFDPDALKVALMGSWTVH
jgi:hypothetical protein